MKTGTYFYCNVEETSSVYHHSDIFSRTGDKSKESTGWGVNQLMSIKVSPPTGISLVAKYTKVIKQKIESVMVGWSGQTCTVFIFIDKAQTWTAKLRSANHLAMYGDVPLTNLNPCHAE